MASHGSVLDEEEEAAPRIVALTSIARESTQQSEHEREGAQSLPSAEPTWVTWMSRPENTQDSSMTIDEVTGPSSTDAAQPLYPSFSRDKPLQLLCACVALNACILVASVFVYVTTSSQLVLAQAADSLLDVGANAVLAFAARVSRQPADLDHLYGHQRAEPIGALVVAVVTVVLAIEVFMSAIQALATLSYPDPDIAIAAVLGAKAALKTGIIVAILVLTSFRPSSDVGLYALFVDTRNDVVASVASLGGFGLIRAGYGWADGALAVLVSIYVAWNGVSLGRENLRYLMGDAPSREVMEELARIAGAVHGVTSVGRIRAQFLGTELQVDVKVVIPENVLVTEAHDVSVQVQRAMEADPRVSIAFVHVDTEETALRHLYHE
jgi:cation diffusion facilitator family transporter